MTRGILAVCLAIFLITIGGCGSKTEVSQPASKASKPAADKGETDSAKAATVPAHQPAAIVVTAEEYAQEAAKDSTACQKKYDGKWVEISGVVLFSSNNTPDGMPLIHLKGAEAKSVACRFQASDADKVDQLVENQKVKIRGKGGWLAGAIFNGEVLEVGASPATTIAAADLAKEFGNAKKATVEKYIRKPLIVEGTVIDVKAGAQSVDFIVGGAEADR